MLLAVGVANAAAAILLWHLFDELKISGVGVVAAVLFLLTLPLAGGHHVNSRPFMLAAFVTKRPAVRGVVVSIGTLFNAYGSVFVIALMWLTWRDTDGSLPAIARYLVASATTAVAVLVVIAIVWSSDAVRAALYWSFGLPVAGGVATSAVHHEAIAPDSYLARSWLVSDPWLWTHYTRTLMLQFLPLLALAGFGWLHRRRILDAGSAARVL